MEVDEDAAAPVLPTPTPPQPQRSSPHEDKKRKMKTPSQLEALERVFAEEKYPSEAVRSRLSAELGLSNRQLKMWFCHRRLKERKSKEDDDDEPASSDRSPQQRGSTPAMITHSPVHYKGSPAQLAVKKEEQPSSGSYEEVAWGKTRKRRERAEVRELESSKKKRSKHPTASSSSSSVDPWRLAELQAIASVESQLGEALRWDSPCLGMEFDPLPPGAFSSPPVSSQHRKSFSSQDSRSRLENRHGSKSDFGNKLQRDQYYAEHSQKSVLTRKPAIATENASGSQSSSRFLQEYQFIPERPTGRDDMAHDRASHAKVYPGQESSRAGFDLQENLLRGNENLGNGFGLDGKTFNVSGSLMLQRDIYNGHTYAQSQMLHQDVIPALHYATQTSSYDNLYYMLQPGASVNAADKVPVYTDEDVNRGNKKRKNEEIRIVKEVEARRKKMQKEIEKEELARRKKEEQMQKEREKEIERIMREKQREDERIQRERQREDDRMQREVRREMERQERLVQKEAQRLEREREKEEARRLKEATRLKAAIERATARRLARECVELIDDERLELLEAAAASQGLPSIYLLDGETLQGLDRYKDSLKKFPPPSVKMKSPLASSPWIDSQQNLGNLFMVWKFLTAFADVLGLWPFTLDEFVQAFHDFDPRLLTEIHISLMKTLVRDIEDVAKVSACGGAVNQYTAPSTIGGGHSQLVEAAFAWGFDYKEWGRHLNPLTWPEILRQFALAAGYGPIWKPHAEVMNGNVEEAHQSQPKVHGVEQNLRHSNRRKGSSHARKCRYRLTPGTVKYAAFHVLTVHGPDGLSIAEIADRIEKNGLRDLSTSKTPESSIAAALSRDSVFFERVAPSTYCVKAAFRRNPEDEEQLIQGALERIRLFQNGVVSDVYGAEKDTEDVDEAEREQTSDEESDSADIDDIDRGKVKKVQLLDKSVVSLQAHDCSGKHSSPFSLASANEAVDGSERMWNPDKAVDSTLDNEIDESHVGEPWVQGLMEGEYSDLSVEERLNALVALIEAVNEGNAIRVALEERMEAAIALKRQMWAEAQQDKRRSKEEQVLKAQSQACEGVKNEALGEGDVKTSAMVSVEGVSRTSFPDSETKPVVQHDNSAAMNTAGPASEKTRAQLKVDIDFRADELYVFRSQPLGLDRRHNRYWQFLTSYIAEDPGCGRIYFESSEDGHWEVIDTEEAFDALIANLDTRGVREAHLHGVLHKIENLIRQGMKKLSVNEQGLQSIGSKISLSKNGSNALMTNAGYMSEDGSSGSGNVFQESGGAKATGAIHIQNGHIQTERLFEQYRVFDKWLWCRHEPENSDIIAMRMVKRCPEILALCETCHVFYWPREKHCIFCHTTFEASARLDARFHHHINECEKKQSDQASNGTVLDSVKLFPSRFQLLKAQLLSIEAAIPMEALGLSWTESQRKTWGNSLKHASAPGELLQLLTKLEGSVKRDWLSSSFETTKELLDVSSEDIVDGLNILPWIPQTTAAVALRLMMFDAALFYNNERKIQNYDHTNKRQPVSTSKNMPIRDSENLSHKVSAERARKERNQTTEGPHRRFLFKVSIGRYEVSSPDKDQKYNADSGGSSHKYNSDVGWPSPHGESQEDEWINGQESDRVNGKHSTEENGQMHYDEDISEEEDDNNEDDEDEELIMQDGYEDVEDGPSQERDLNVANEEADSVDLMDEDIDDDVDEQSHRLRHLRQDDSEDRRYGNIESDSSDRSD